MFNTLLFKEKKKTTFVWVIFWVLVDNIHCKLTYTDKHLKEDSVQAINKALAEQEDRGPEAIMDTVRIFSSLK